MSPATGLEARIYPGVPDHIMTSEHPGAAGAWCPRGPAALCQRVAADDQIQGVTRLSQEWHCQAAVEVPRANAVDLHHAEQRGQARISSAWAEVAGSLGFPKMHRHRHRVNLEKVR